MHREDNRHASEDGAACKRRIRRRRLEVVSFAQTENCTWEPCSEPALVHSVFRIGGRMGDAGVGGNESPR